MAPGPATISVLFGSHEEFNEKVAERLDRGRYAAEYLSGGVPERPLQAFDCFVPQRFDDYAYPASVGAEGCGNYLSPAPEQVVPASTHRRHRLSLPADPQEHRQAIGVHRRVLLQLQDARRLPDAV